MLQVHFCAHIQVFSLQYIFLENFFFRDKNLNQDEKGHHLSYTGPAEVSHKKRIVLVVVQKLITTQRDAQGLFASVLEGLIEIFNC